MGPVCCSFVNFLCFSYFRCWKMWPLRLSTTSLSCLYQRESHARNRERSVEDRSGFKDTVFDWSCVMCAAIKWRLDFLSKRFFLLRWGLFGLEGVCFGWHPTGTTYWWRHCFRKDKWLHVFVFWKAAFIVSEGEGKRNAWLWMKLHGDVWMYGLIEEGETNRIRWEGGAQWWCKKRENQPKAETTAD